MICLCLFVSKSNYPKMPNYNLVTKFLLQELRVLHTMLFLLIYLGTLMGNLFIVTATTFSHSLHTPMYFFLSNLSVLDMCYISVTIPKAYIIFLLDNWVISMVGCAGQIFFLFSFASVELLLLTAMAQDHYVAICEPHYYPVIMKPCVCVQMTVASIVIGFIYSDVHTGNIFFLFFCQSNVVHQFFCDIPSLLWLSCSDTFSNQVVIFISAVVVGGGSFTFISMSSIFIFSAVLKFPSTRERGKAYSTCAPHILIVSVFLTLGTAVHRKPTSNSPSVQDMIISLFYAILPPFLNSINYSLRNKQIKQAVRRIFSRNLFSGK